MITSIGKGKNQNTSEAFVQLQKNITTKHGIDEDYPIIRSTACGNEEATKKAFRRSRQKQYPVVKNFSDLSKTKLMYTLRGLTDNPRYQSERQVLHVDQKMIVLSSNRLLQLLADSKIIIADGTFFYSPYETQQVYRIFSFAKSNPNQHCVPAVTAILKGEFFLFNRNTKLRILVFRLL